MNLKAVSDSFLLSHTQELVQKERALTTEILHHLREISSRRLHATLACSSLFDYCTRVLGYSEAQAQRRICAARLLDEIPEIEPRIASGALKLTTLTQAYSYFRNERKAGKPLSGREKADVLQKLEHQSSRKTERILIALSPASAIPKERTRALSDEYTEVRFAINEELRMKLAQVKEKWNMPGAGHAELLTKLLDFALEKDRTEERTIVQRRASSAPKVPKILKAQRGRHIPLPLRREVWRRDGGQCSFTDRKSGVRCPQRTGLQLDHIHSFAKGGGHSAENLRLRCLLHNQRHAIETFGLEKMKPYLTAKS